MVTSILLADVGSAAALRLLRTKLSATEVPGLRHAITVAAAPLGPRMLPAPRPGRAGLIAVWESDAALDAFLGAHPVAAALDGGYRVRLAPVRVVGEWPEFGDVRAEVAVNGAAEVEGPVAVLTLGRLRLNRAPAFLRASARAEDTALSSPGLLLATGLAHPPQIVSTFSVWSDAASMRAYVERQGGGHGRATAQHATKPFHHQSAFIRFRPYDQSGTWHAPGT